VLHAVWEAIKEMSGRRRRPPETPTEVVDHLESEYLPGALSLLRMPSKT
jgi:hypothetical protein